MIFSLICSEKRCSYEFAQKLETTVTNHCDKEKNVVYSGTATKSSRSWSSITNDFNHHARSCEIPSFICWRYSTSCSASTSTCPAILHLFERKLSTVRKRVYRPSIRTNRPNAFFSERKSIDEQRTEYWSIEKDDMKFAGNIRSLTGLNC